MKKNYELNLMGLCIMIRTRTRHNTGRIKSIFGMAISMAAENLIKDPDSMDYQNAVEITDTINCQFLDNSSGVIDILGLDIIELSVDIYKSLINYKGQTKFQKMLHKHVAVRRTEEIRIKTIVKHLRAC